MSQLYKHLRIHQIFGANTDVGKTILTTALARASATRNIPVFYLKPVSTGRPEDADDGSVNFTAPQISAQDYTDTSTNMEEHQILSRLAACIVMTNLSARTWPQN
jgi:dethiobiotin synthetase/adenosylmethionine--8-amino-7-oxononanoate aminotransferase